MSDDQQPFIQVQNVHYHYDAGSGAPVVALRGVSFDLHRGEFVALVGANGSGKTTLARHLNALLRPTEGRVRVDGLDTRDAAHWPHVRSQVAMVFQRPEDQIVGTTVEDDVAFGPENLGLPGAEIEARVRRALETVHLWELRHRPPHLLSVGQQQRVALAGALAMRPRGLVLDEATAMLDPVSREEVLALLHRLHAAGLTIVHVTHWMREVTQAGRVIVLDAGEVAFDGSPQDLFADPARLRTWGLEPPPLVALARQLRRRHADFPAGSPTVEGLAAALRPRLRAVTPAPASPADPAVDPEEPLVSVTGLRYTYLPGTPLATPALRGIDLTVRAGEVVALVGGTGSGKTTLFQQVAGLLRPEAGRVCVRGRDVHAPDADRRALCHQVGLLFQRSEEQLFEIYVGDDVAFGPRQWGLGAAEVRERVRWAMDTVGLPFVAFKDRFTQGLSGGERRKAALAGVLALRPRILLLDEPTAGLDPRARRELLSTLRHLNRREGVTLLVATHAMEDVAELADRMVILDAGRIVARGTPRRLFAQPALLAAHRLAVPEIAALMHRLGGDEGPPEAILTVAEALEAFAGGGGGDGDV
jgi:energy-coupling factor transport system ATP-binding protein